VLAVDANLVLRLLTEDDPILTVRARELFERERIFVPKTVILEAGWVLGRSYNFSVMQILHAFERMLSLPNVTCEDAEAVTDAIQWARRGIDFADALHLASSRGAAQFVTFDRKFARRASAITDIKIRTA